MPRYSWHTTPKAKRAFGKLTADDIGLMVVTPIMGDRHYAWSATVHADKLKAIRTAYVDAAFGASFAQLTNDTQRRAYVAFDRAIPSVADALDLIIGPACQFGRPSLGETLADVRHRSVVEAAFAHGAQAVAA